MNASLTLLKRRIIPILKRNNVVKAGIFGSYARGEQTKKSDIDLLIKFKGKKSLLDMVGLKIELEEKLKKKIDLVEYSIVHPFLKERIKEEEIKII